MKHPEQLDLSCWLDNELPAHKRADIDQHLEQCAICQNLVQELQAPRQITLGSLAVKVPPFFAERIVAKFKRQHAESFWDGFVFIPKNMQAISMVSSLVALVLVIQYHTPEKNGITDFDLYASTLMPEEAQELFLASEEEALSFAMDEYIINVGETR